MTSNYDKAISVRFFFPPFPLSHKVGKKHEKIKAEVSQLVKGMNHEARESCYCEEMNAGDSCQVCVFQWS